MTRHVLSCEVDIRTANSRCFEQVSQSRPILWFSPSYRGSGMRLYTTLSLTSPALQTKVFSEFFWTKCLGYRGGTLTVLRLVRLIFWTTKSSTLRVRCPPNINALIVVIFFVIRSSLSLVDTASATVAIWRILGELNIHCFWLFDCKTIWFFKHNSNVLNQFYGLFCLIGSWVQDIKQVHLFIEQSN